MAVAAGSVKHYTWLVWVDCFSDSGQVLLFYFEKYAVVCPHEALESLHHVGFVRGFMDVVDGCLDVCCVASGLMMRSCCPGCVRACAACPAAMVMTKEYLLFAL